MIACLELKLSCLKNDLIHGIKISVFDLMHQNNRIVIAVKYHEIL